MSFLKKYLSSNKLILKLIVSILETPIQKTIGR